MFHFIIIEFIIAVQTGSVHFISFHFRTRLSSFCLWFFKINLFDLNFFHLRLFFLTTLLIFPRFFFSFILSVWLVLLRSVPCYSSVSGELLHREEARKSRLVSWWGERRGTGQSILEEGCFFCFFCRLWVRKSVIQNPTVDKWHSSVFHRLPFSLHLRQNRTDKQFRFSCFSSAFCIYFSFSW